MNVLKKSVNFIVSSKARLGGLITLLISLAAVAVLLSRYQIVNINKFDYSQEAYPVGATYDTNLPYTERVHSQPSSYEPKDDTLDTRPRDTGFDVTSGGRTETQTTTPPEKSWWERAWDTLTSTSGTGMYYSESGYAPDYDELGRRVNPQPKSYDLDDAKIEERWRSGATVNTIDVWDRIKNAAGAVVDYASQYPEYGMYYDDYSRGTQSTTTGTTTDEVDYTELGKRVNPQPKSYELPDEPESYEQRVHPQSQPESYEQRVHPQSQPESYEQRVHPQPKSYQLPTTSLEIDPSAYARPNSQSTTAPPEGSLYNLSESDWEKLVEMVNHPDINSVNDLKKMMLNIAQQKGSGNMFNTNNLNTIAGLVSSNLGSFNVKETIATTEDFCIGNLCTKPGTGNRNLDPNAVSGYADVNNLIGSPLPGVFKPFGTNDVIITQVTSDPFYPFSFTRDTGSQPVNRPPGSYIVRIRLKDTGRLMEMYPNSNNLEEITEWVRDVYENGSSGQFGGQWANVQDGGSNGLRQVDLDAVGGMSVNEFYTNFAGAQNKEAGTPYAFGYFIRDQDEPYMVNPNSLTNPFSRTMLSLGIEFLPKGSAPGSYSQLPWNPPPTPLSSIGGVPSSFGGGTGGGGGCTGGGCGGFTTGDSQLFTSEYGGAYKFNEDDPSTYAFASFILMKYMNFQLPAEFEACLTQSLPDYELEEILQVLKNSYPDYRMAWIQCFGFEPSY